MTYTCDEEALGRLRRQLIDEVDMVNHPPHYTGHPKGIECIDVVEDAPRSNLAAAMKYLWRVLWGSKGNDIQDLEKARWYIDREISRMKDPLGQE